MTILPATISDLGTLGALECACFDQPWSRSTLSAALDEDIYAILLVRDEGSALAVDAAGYAIGWNVGDEAELARVGVHESLRGRGFGREITQALLEVFRDRGVKTVYLEVRSANLAAQHLYQKCGFSPVGKRPDYYADGETAIIMSATL